MARPDELSVAPEPQIDTLSEVLKAVRLSGAVFLRGHFSAPFALKATSAEMMLAFFPPESDHIMPFHLVTRGELHVDVDGHGPHTLGVGDIILLPHGSAHTLRDKPGEGFVDAATLQETGTPPTLTFGGGGDRTEILCGFFHCRGQIYNPLMQALPDVIVVGDAPDRSAWLTATAQRTLQELVAQRPGSAAVIERLVDGMFIEVVQRYLDESAPEGWLVGVSDPVVGRALGRIHSEPATDWTVDVLAREAAVSRSVLADRFSKLIGMSPIRYLTCWRMELASQRLRHTSDPIAQIAVEVGYESEASFNRAFKRHVGDPPAAWRTAQLEQIEQRRAAFAQMEGR